MKNVEGKDLLYIVYTYIHILNVSKEDPCFKTSERINYYSLQSSGPCKIPPRIYKYV